MSNADFTRWRADGILSPHRPTSRRFWLIFYGVQNEPYQVVSRPDSHKTPYEPTLKVCLRVMARRLEGFFFEPYCDVAYAIATVSLVIPLRPISMPGSLQLNFCSSKRSTSVSHQEIGICRRSPLPLLSNAVEGHKRPNSIHERRRAQGVGLKAAEMHIRQLNTTKMCAGLVLACNEPTQTAVPQNKENVIAEFENENICADASVPGRRRVNDAEVVADAVLGANGYPRVFNRRHTGLRPAHAGRSYLPDLEIVVQTWSQTPWCSARKVHMEKATKLSPSQPGFQLGQSLIPRSPPLDPPGVDYAV
ncbi:hypothetical protein BKA62DRAFT_674601 [Auriculariales sp. MPI-PUGE-AT-0066]|nr:hypothetical protein BKA62DRAFT_674601 [Auriculariales sp. MPI-PUGE-AT-0066]